MGGECSKYTRSEEHIKTTGSKIWGGGRPRFVWKNDIKMDVTELSFASMCFCERVLDSYISGQDAVLGLLRMR